MSQSVKNALAANRCRTDVSKKNNRILNLIINWLEYTDAFIDWDTLIQINEFVVNVEGPPEVINVALRAANTISERVRETFWNSGPLTRTLSRNSTASVVQHAIPKPEEVALALAVLEGKIFKELLPSECIAYVRGHAIGSHSVQRAFDFNKQISSWVKQSILLFDSYEERATMKTFFVKAAEVIYFFSLRLRLLPQLKLIEDIYSIVSQFTTFRL
jgi:hypothetical protein